PLFDPGGYFNVEESWGTNQAWSPPSGPPDHHFQQKCVEFQVMRNATMAPPPPEPSDIGHTAV
ncbi:hypothetical protein A2U01_0112431, partial [Trifolium medium]|nr:hypothetical protein [Trifolium medium]